MTNRENLKENNLPVINMEGLEEQLAQVLLWYDEKYCGNIDGAREVLAEYLDEEITETE